MKFRKPVLEPVEINLTPMIDCLLFLVVFLLLSTTFNKYSRLNIVLPQAEGVPLAKQAKKVEVAVAEDGTYRVNNKPVSGTTANELMTAIKQEVGDARDLPMVIAADSKTTHQAVVRVMDVAGRLGFVNLNISTRQPAQDRNH